MRSAHLVLAAWALAGGGHSSPAYADIPSPTNSYVDPCLIACPEGDVEFRVVARHFSNTPVAGSHVVINVCDCPTGVLCPANPSQSYSVTGCQAYLQADLNGEARFPLQAGGGCAAGSVKIYADGVLLASRALASPDQDGSGYVEAADAAILDAKIAGGAFDPTADLNCDGALSSADRAVFDLHRGHAFPIPTPVPWKSWGSVKAFYR